MRPALLVFALSDPAYLPLLRALAAAGPWDIHLLPPALVDPARAEGLPVHDGFALLDAGTARRVEAEGSALVDRALAVEDRIASHFTADGVSLWPRMRGPFLRTLLGAAVRCGTMTAIMEAIAARSELRAVVLGFDTVPAGRAAVATARRLGVPTIHVPHGVLGRPRVPLPWQGAAVFADVVCAPGDFSRRGYLANGAGPDQVVVTGSPRWDGYAGVGDEARAAARSRVTAALGLDPAAPILVYGSSWLERSTANSCAYVGAGLSVYQAVLAAVRQQAARGVQLVVKLHPGECTRPGMDVGALMEGYRGVARRAGVARLAITEGHKVDLLAAADVVVGVNSNLGIEALLCGRPVVNVPLLADEADGLFTPGDGVLALGDPSETTAAVAAVLADAGLRARLAANARRTALDYEHLGDGRASERVAAVVAAAGRA